MGFNWNFKPKTINGFDSQPVDTLNPQVQPQPIQMAPVGLRGNETWRNQYNMPQTQRAAYMDEYEADQKWNEQPAELMQKADQGRISALENEIATLKQRIQENTAKLNNWTGNADQIAAIEARKINGADPTSIWRWKEDRDNARRIANAQNSNNNTAKANAMIEIANDLDSIIVDDKMTSQDQKAYLSKLANMKTLGEKTGVPKSVIDSINAKIKEVKGENNSEESNKRDSKYSGKPNERYDSEIDELLANPTMERIAKWKLNNPDWQKYASNAKITALEAKHTELIDANNKKNEARNFEQFLKDNGFPNGSSGMNQMVLESMKRRWNKGKK